LDLLHNVFEANALKSEERDEIDVLLIHFAKRRKARKR